MVCAQTTWSRDTRRVYCPLNAIHRRVVSPGSVDLDDGFSDSSAQGFRRPCDCMAIRCQLGERVREVRLRVSGHLGQRDRLRVAVARDR
jgi:hypothetical protein